MSINLHNFAKKNGVKYFFVSFVDLFGVLRSKLVPATAIDEIQSEGAGFAGFATWLDMSPADSDMFGMPDGDSVIQLPWNKEIAWVASDLYMDGKPVEASPRIAAVNCCCCSGATSPQPTAPRPSSSRSNQPQRSLNSPAAVRNGCSRAKRKRRRCNRSVIRRSRREPGPDLHSAPDHSIPGSARPETCCR